jgi:hypothetical protein
VLGTEEEEGYRTGPPGYIGWRNSFLRIDSESPYTFKNTGSAAWRFLVKAKLNLAKVYGSLGSDYMSLKSK